MKIPEKTPDSRPIDVPLTPEISIRLSEIIRKANNEYMYWDEFKYLTMPVGIAPEQAWSLLKMYRLVQKKFISLVDSHNNPFSYCLPDCVHRDIHYIDQQAGGSIVVDDPSVASEERRRYMMRSLVEEAISSSQIEGAATTRVVAKEMLRTGRKPKDHSEQMIYNNFQSMQMLKKHLKEPLSIELLLEIHRHMTRDTLEDASWAGRFRTPADDKIYVFDNDEQTVLHVPPDAAKIADLMQKLCDFANSDGQDEFVNPIIKGILLHFWLAYVHPFMDGNGRTARALFYWYVLKHGYWGFEYLSVSTAILSARAQYYRSFLYSEMDGNDATYFIVYNLKALHKAIEILNEYIARKQKEKDNVRRLSGKYPMLNYRQRSLLAAALQKTNAVYTIETHAKIHGVTYQTARTDLLGLKDLGLLIMAKSGKKFIFSVTVESLARIEK
ncbi:MAG: Fic family protein [Nitrospirota bacterium]|nr:Fic family protein [Nitrospirota bacterium]